MPTILPLSATVVHQAKRYGVETKLHKQLQFLAVSIRHPSLHFELLHTPEMDIYSFRLDKKYRALCYRREGDAIEVIAVTVHYH